MLSRFFSFVLHLQQSFIEGGGWVVDGDDTTDIYTRTKESKRVIALNGVGGSVMVAVGGDNLEYSSSTLSKL